MTNPDTMCTVLAAIIAAYAGVLHRRQSQRGHVIRDLTRRIATLEHRINNTHPHPPK